jgi:lantibiotic modifying enzyme
VGSTDHQDYTLCHGWLGVAEFLLYAGRILSDESATVLAHRIAATGIEHHGADPSSWRCGLWYGSNPSLMLGWAGIGYFYLRLADPSIPSVVLVTPDACP